jgi:predicted nuclease of predicted toxin-antitoxin system
VTVHFAADENFNRRIVVGMLRRAERIDLVRVQDGGLTAADDPAVLQWAANENRVLLTHDVATMPDFAYERIAAGLPMRGLLVVSATLPLAEAIDELALITEASETEEWDGQVVYLPLR